jgi:hypothetical protein
MSRNQTVGASLLAKAPGQPTNLLLMSRNQTVGAGLLAKAPGQSTNLLLMSRNQTVGVSLLAIAVVHSAEMLADTPPSQKEHVHPIFPAPAPALSNRSRRSLAGGFSFVQVRP